VLLLEFGTHGYKSLDLDYFEKEGFREFLQLEVFNQETEWFPVHDLRAHLEKG
jgi:hypothetical protein